MSENVSPGQDLTSKQAALIPLLLAGKSHKVAAATLKVDEKTVTRWTKLPQYRAAYKEAQKQVFDESLSTLMLASGDALRVLRVIMLNGETPAPARVRAAQIILEQAIKVYEISEMQQKISEIDKLLKQSGK